MPDFPSTDKPQTHCSKRETVLASGVIGKRRQSRVVGVSCARKLRDDGLCPKHGLNTK